MTQAALPYELVRLTAPRFGLIALQTDETIEADMRRLLPARAEVMVSRVPSGAEVSPESLAEMEHHLQQAAALLPMAQPFDVVGYGCTSGTAQIGVDRVAAAVNAGIPTGAVTQPLSSLLAACAHLGVRRLGLLTPYAADVSERLRAELTRAGIETPVFGSFEVPTEATVVRISERSVREAGRSLAAGADIEALFISCTNLRTLGVISPLEDALGIPVLSSNQVLAWHMLHLAGVAPPAAAPGRLFAS